MSAKKSFSNHHSKFSGCKTSYFAKISYANCLILFCNFQLFKLSYFANFGYSSRFVIY